jgi:hypothetical protein
MTDKELILELRGIILSQAQQIKTLEEKVTILLEQLQQKNIKKDSHNSSLAPSSDLFMKNKSLRQVSNRKSGGQPGHKGFTLEMSSSPDSIIQLKSSFCNHCSASLEDENHVLKAKRQVVEIPIVKPIYNEFQQYSCQCSNCGSKQSASFPADVKAPIQYGCSVETLVSYLSVYQSIPFKRMQKMFTQVFSLPLSQGTVDNILHRVAEKCEVVYEEIKAAIVMGSVAGSDETGAKVNGEKWWIWVWQNVLTTFIVASPSRGFNTIESVFKEGLPNLIVVSDRWAAQLKMITKGKQICLAHLIRDLVFLEETEKHTFAIQFKQLLLKVFEIKKTHIQDKKAYHSNHKDALKLEQELNKLLAIVIEEDKYGKTGVFQKSMIKNRNHLFTCLYNLEVPPDNNASERAIRIIKVKQKVSGQFKTGQHAFCVIRSVIDSLIKRNLEVISHFNQIISIQAE